MVDNQYKVSIITVVYNGVKTIEETIQSVMGQTYKNIEYIIIDGLSTDGTQQIIEKYMNAIDDYVCEKDDGLFDAMNKGIQRATGEIIGIINSDDWYAQDAVERAISIFEQNDTELVHGRISTVCQDGSNRVSPILPLEMLWYQMVVSHPSVFVRKSVYEKYGLFNTEYKYASDYELILRFYSNHVKFSFIDAVMAHFRVGGFSYRNIGRKIEERRDICMNYVDLCPDKGKALEEIQKRFENQGFLVAINKKKMLPELLNIYFGELPSAIIIFGTGEWGNKCYERLKDGMIKVELFADNDSSKWNQEFHGIRIARPEELRDMEGYVLIAVRYHGEKIRHQIEGMGNKKIKCVSLVDLVGIFSSLAENKRNFLWT